MKYSASLKVDTPEWNAMATEDRQQLIEALIRSAPHIPRPVVELIPHEDLAYMKIRVIPGR